MRLVRDLEQRIESLLDGMVGRVFGGSLHPAELAAKLVRVADLSLSEGPYGPVAANSYTIVVNPADIADAASRLALQLELARLLEEAAFERGWRLEGPTEVTIHTDPAVAPATPTCTASVAPGTRPAWAVLRGEDVLDVEKNRSVVGRGEAADIGVADERVSRTHALIWSEGGRVLIRDLGSANGTRLDGGVVGERPEVLRNGSVVAFGPVAFRFEKR